MNERRMKRSQERDDALQHLLDHVSKVMGDHGVALVDERGRLLAGAGRPHEMWAAARAAVSPGERVHVRGEPAVRAHIEAKDESLRLAALGSVAVDRGLHDTARSVARILATTA